MGAGGVPVSQLKKTSPLQAYAVSGRKEGVKRAEAFRLQFSISPETTQKSKLFGQMKRFRPSCLQASPFARWASGFQSVVPDLHPGPAASRGT